MTSLLIADALVMTCEGPGLGLVAGGAVLVDDNGRVAWVGPTADAPAGAARRIEAEGRLVTPGLVDAHAHPIFGGERSGEFAQRAEGCSYLEIAARGGGILATVRATREAGDDTLLAGARARLLRAVAHGTTTMEAKTGYALSVEGELRLLALLGRLGPPTLCPTLLGAHAVPPGVARADYVADCAGPMLDGARGAVAVDVFCDEGAFTLDEARTILGAAKARGLAVRAHAGQFSDLGAAGMVASLGGLSADHLEHVSDDQAFAMAFAGTAATLLPGACVQLRLPPPPVARLRAAGCRFALGTDLNPGSSMTESLPLQMWLATTHLGLTVEEAWLAVTRDGARAAGRPEVGRLAPGAPADMVLWDAIDFRTIPYHYGARHVHTVWVAGREIVGPQSRICGI